MRIPQRWGGLSHKQQLEFIEDLQLGVRRIMAIPSRKGEAIQYVRERTGWGTASARRWVNFVMEETTNEY
jgi:hypothetical protein